MQQQNDKCFLLTVVAFLASTPFFANAKTIDTGTAAPYVTETRIAASRQVGDFSLEFAETTPVPGAEFRYALRDHPELRITLTARGTGGMSDEEALQLGTELYRSSTFKEVFSASQYRDIQTTEPAAFAIPLTGSNPAPSLNGMVFDQRYNMLLDFLPERVEMQSRDFVFSRGMHVIHLSASAAVSRIDRSTFEALAARAARELVPTLSLSNIGRCGQSPDRNDRHCFATRADVRAQEPVDAEIVTIEYEPHDWKEP